MSNSSWPQGPQQTRPRCPSPTPRAYSNSCLLSWWCHQTISSSVIPFSSHLQFSQHQGLFKWVSSSHQVAKVLQLQLQHQSFQWIFRTDVLHAKFPCPSLSSRVFSNSSPLSQWHHLTFSFTITPFPFCSQSFPASGSFPVSQLFSSGGQSIGAQASASVLLMDIQDWFNLGLTGLICLLFKGPSFSNTKVWKHF